MSAEQPVSEGEASSREPSAERAAASGKESSRPAPGPNGQPPSRRKPDPRPIDWEKVTDEELLAKRICDLPVSIEGAWFEELIHQVYDELDAKGIGFHPPVYLGDEWFTPEDDPVISVPFYLAHSRLIRLQRARVLEAEGENRRWFLQLLRHEVGHALAHAYGLYRHRGFSKVFGPRSKPYTPETYRPRVYSRKFVVHLEDWYAQGHPEEDFAETFAVWLTPEIDWRQTYKGWPALKKLEFIDKLMSGIGGKPPLKRTARKYRHLPTIRMTIAQFHRVKRKELEEDFPDFFDRDLRAIFSEEKGPTGMRAAKFLRRHRTGLVRSVAQWTGEKRYTIRHLVTRFAERCEDLKLFVHNPDAVTLVEVTACLTAMATNYFLTGKFKRHR